MTILADLISIRSVLNVIQNWAFEAFSFQKASWELAMAEHTWFNFVMSVIWPYRKTEMWQHVSQNFVMLTIRKYKNPKLWQHVTKHLVNNRIKRVLTSTNLPNFTFVLEYCDILQTTALKRVHTNSNFLFSHWCLVDYA